MGIGKAVFLTDGEELRHLPAASYIPVSGGATEEAELEELFLMLAECPDRTRHIGALARQHIEREHDLAYVAARYAGFLRAARAVAVNAAG
jgi:hypothetical protein